MNNNNALISSLNFVALDIETTGLDSSQDVIIEVGAVQFTKNNVVKTFEQLVYTDMPIPPEAYNVHGISNEMLKDAPPLQEVMPLLLNFIADSIIVIHNASFDMAFLHEATQHLALPPIRNEIIDTIEIARKAFPGKVTYRLQALGQELSLGYEDDQAHRSLHDAIICMRLFEKSIATLGFMGELTLGEIKE